MVLNGLGGVVDLEKKVDVRRVPEIKRASPP